MFALKEKAKLTEPQLRTLVDELAIVQAQRKEAEARETAIKAELHEAALLRSVDTLTGRKHKLLIITEWQQRIDTAKLRARFTPAALEPFYKATKVVKFVLQPLYPTLSAAEPNEPTTT
jgi:prolyl-tRNA editing enzyme YbaK/EbsC (Cys-tRNA(Pro) deacylase)